MRRFVFILIGLHVSLTALIGNYCGCSEQDRDACYGRDCSWSDKNQTCYSDPDVEWVYNCTQYTVTEATKQECYTKGNVCVPGAASNDGSVVCESGTINCPDITDKSICHLVRKTRQIYCFWDFMADSCLEQNYEFCSKITDLSMCAVKNCEYKYPGCEPLPCSKLKNETSCTYTRMDSVFQNRLCIWQNGACVDAQNTSHLNATTCFYNSGGTFKWRNNSCVPCTGQIDNETIDSNNNTNTNNSTNNSTDSTNPNNSTNNSNSNDNNNSTDNGNNTNNNNSTNNNSTTGTDPTSTNGTSGNSTKQNGEMLLWLGIIQLIYQL